MSRNEPIIELCTHGISYTACDGCFAQHWMNHVAAAFIVALAEGDDDGRMAVRSDELDMRSACAVHGVQPSEGCTCLACVGAIDARTHDVSTASVRAAPEAL